MDLILAALIAGVIVGAAGLLPDGWGRQLDRVMTLTLFLLLVALGAQIGGNGELLANLGRLGWQAAVISACSLAGSIIVLWLTARCFGLGGKGDDA
jgi:uncharacterized membrane protein YbjE (DUF340 family)